MLKKINIVTLAIFVIAFGMRLIALNQSLWLDEAVSANTVAHYSYQDLIFVFAKQDFHPPFFYLMLKLWTSIFGVTEVALRLPSVIFSICTGAILYKIVAQKFNTRTAQITTALFLFNPLIVYYSQEARMYAMVTLWLAALTYFELQPPSKKIFVAIAALTTLSILTFYGSVFYVAALVAISVIFKSFSKTFAYILGLCVALGFALLFLPQQLQTAHIATSAIAGWSQVLGTVTFKNLGLIPLKLVTGRVSFEPKIIYYVLGGSSCVAYYLPLIKLITPPLGAEPSASWRIKGDNSGLMQKRATLFFALTLALPLLFGLLTSFLFPMLQYFRFIYLLLPLCMLLAVAVQDNKKLSIFLIVLSVSWSLAYLLQPTTHRENWRAAVAGIKTPSVYMMPPQSDPVKYYNPDLEVLDLRSISTLPKNGCNTIVDSSIPRDDNAKCNDGAHNPGKLTVIPYATEIYGLNYAQILTQNGYKLSSKRDFRGVMVEEWLHNL